MIHALVFFVLAVTIVGPSTGTADDHISPEKAADALNRAVDFFRSQVAEEGGYLWRYAADFSQREGEVPASLTTVWVQPPGTPTVGAAYLAAHELTGNRLYLAAARETAVALVQGQLESGGWDYRIEFGAEDRAQFAYRVDSAAGTNDSMADQRLRNVTTLDDNTTQAALSFLMRVDHRLDFEDASIHEAAEYALRKLVAAQYPNGAWPQRFTAAADPQRFPVKPAGYPAEWPREHPNSAYRSYYTFNDNSMTDVIVTMFLAAEIYGDQKYAEAGRRGGEFILLSQMPEPQPGWAQQYDAEMHPAWARKFEPPAITGAESQRVMETLLRLFELTGERRFLEPLPRALAYFRRSLLKDGRLARFYELETNRPLYFTKDYRLTYSDGDLPTHYSFQSGNRLDKIEARFRQLTATADSEVGRSRVLQKQPVPPLNQVLADAAAELVRTQDARGAWVERANYRARSKIPVAMPSLSSRTFAANIVLLAQYLAASSADRPHD